MNRHKRWALLQGLVLILAGSATQLHAEEAAAPLIEQEVLRGYLADPGTLTLIDARSAEEFAAGHLEGAINLPMDQVDARMNLLPPDRDTTIIVYCVAGKRAAKVVDALSVRGYRNARVLPPAQMMYYGDTPALNCATATGDSISPLASGDASQPLSACWQQQSDIAADAGEALWGDTDLGTNGMTCAECHPRAANIDPASFPKHLRHLGRVGEMPEMINWCIRDTLKGEPLAIDDPAMIALQAYLARERKQAPGS